MTHRLRHRRRVARVLYEARTLRAKAGREWRWLRRDIRDLRAELRALDRIEERVVARAKNPDLARDLFRRRRADVLR